MIILATVFFFLGFIYPAEAKYSCGKISSVFQTLMNSGFAYASSAENASAGISVSLFIDNQDNWRLVGVDKDLNACIIMAGTRWQFIMMGKI